MLQIAHRAGFEVRNMLEQGAGWRDTEDEVDIVGAAPIDDQPTAIMAVGADQDPMLATSGRFSSRHIVDCDARSRPDCGMSRAILKTGSQRSRLASLPSS